MTNLTTILKTDEDKEKVINLFSENYREAAHLYFPISKKSITPISQEKNTWFQDAAKMNPVITFNGYLLQKVLRAFGIYTHEKTDLSLLLVHPIVEIGLDLELIDSQVYSLLVKERNNGIDIVVILDNGEINFSSHSEPFHVIWSNDNAAYKALTKV